MNQDLGHRAVRLRRLLAAGVAFVAWQALALWCRAQDRVDGGQRPIVAIEGVAVVDVVNGRIVAPRTVLIADGRIAAIEEPGAAAPPPTAVRVDGRGHYLMPGLVDMHVHLFNLASRRPPNDWAFPLLVANGVTSVREMNSEPAAMPIIARWRAALARGDLIAPRVLAAGIATRGDSVGVVRSQVLAAHAVGADFIKVFSDTPEAHWRVILDEARELNMPVCGHVPAGVDLLTAARAGQRSNEHLTQVYEASSRREEALLSARQGRDGREAVELRDAQEREVLESFDQGICAQTAAALARTSQAQVPTLVLPHFEARGARANFRDDARWRLLRRDEQARWKMILTAAERVGDERLDVRRWEISRAIVKTLHAAGVRILAGTDTPMPLVYPGFSLHQELELLVESGLSPADALRAGTLWPAEFLGLSESSGSIAVGNRADLVLLEGDPLHQISNTQRIRAVVLDGRLLRRADLDALLNPVTGNPPALQ